MGTPATTPQQYAALAEVLLSVARALSHLGRTEPGIIDLSPLEALTMRQIDREPGLNTSSLAARLHLTTSNASTALRHLEAKGFIERRLDPDDARAVRIHPTETAQTNLAQKRGVWARILTAHLDPDLASGSLATTLTLLERLDASLGRPAPTESPTPPHAGT